MIDIITLKRFCGKYLENLLSSLNVTLTEIGYTALRGESQIKNKCLQGNVCVQIRM